MPYVIPPEHPQGSIDIEYDRLDRFLQQGDKQSIESMCESIASDQNASSNQIAIARLFRGLVSLAEGRTEEGLRTLGEAALGPEYIKIRAISAIAQALIASGYLESAAAVLAPYIADPPPSVELHLALGIYFSATGDAEAEWRLYTKAQRLNPTFPPLMKQMALAGRGMVPERVALLEEALAEFLDEQPQNGNIRTYHAECLLALGRVDEAWAEVQRTVAFLELSPVDDEALELLRSLTVAIDKLSGRGDV